MKNRDVYLTDPNDFKLLNEGVANVNTRNEDVLRYELSTFVCDGQYGKGVQRILETFLGNINEPDQSGVWVSGFYGSGKSHLVKMLSHLWVNTAFDDGATAREIAKLPSEIKDLFVELDNEAKRHGGLHSASGTLKAHDDEGKVRTALLGLIFKSVGLPEKYHHASFVLWLQEEGILDEVKQKIEAKGKDWNKEVMRLHLSKDLQNVLVETRPDLFDNVSDCRESLRHQFPTGKDVTSDEMLRAIRQAVTKDDKFPLTLIVLDEVQQYVGDDSDRSLDVQEVVEDCCKNFGGKLLFIATGQTAVTGTANLRKLQGRFRIPVELSDLDVDRVIRKVILAKRTDAIDPIKKVMNNNIGEISRHLSDSSIGHKPDDKEYFHQDYPILPTRRRFWENTLRLLDPSGTESQLRNQLSMVHNAIKTNLEKSIGHVIPGDYLYFDSAITLQQSHILPRNVYESTMKWIEGNKEEQIMARACGLIFLINKISSQNQELGLKAEPDTIADLMVTDITGKNGDIRGKLPDILDKCPLLIKVDDEYRIQTQESFAWEEEFKSQKEQLANQGYRIDAEREDRIKKEVESTVKAITLQQGKTKETRQLHTLFDDELPPDANKKLYVWVRNGWETDENSVRVDAREAGTDSPTTFVYIPNRAPDDLRKQITEMKAASATLELKGNPDTPEGQEARVAMETRKHHAEHKVRELIKEAFAGAVVFQGGGSQISGSDLGNAIKEAAENALVRLYPRFKEADHPGWEKVYNKAKKGAPEALKAVGHDGEPGDHPVCKTIYSHIGSGKTGTEIRTYFQDPGFGWPQDAIDGSLLVLINGGLIRAQNDRGKAIEAANLERRDIGKTHFRVETTTVTAKHRIEIRKLLQKMDITASNGQEITKLPVFVEQLESLIARASGEPPKPAKPEVPWLESIKQLSGNEQLIALYENRREIAGAIDEWTQTAEKISKREHDWIVLKRLSDFASDLDDAEMLVGQVEQIEQNRKLLEDPNPVEPLLQKLSDMLRKHLKELEKEWDDAVNEGIEKLKNNDNWQQLDQEARNRLMAEQKLTDKDRPDVKVESSDDILNTLQKLSIPHFTDRINAIPARFDKIAFEAAKLLEPEVQEVELPSRVLKEPEDVDQWLDETREVILERIKNGPVAL